MRNPFRGKSHDVVDTTPEPGGVLGGYREYDYRNWPGGDYSPPIVPYKWGQMMAHEWGHNYMVQWINQPLPTERYIEPIGVDTIAHIFPAIYGTDGSYQLQLNEQAIPPNGGTPVALAMLSSGAALQQIPPASPSALVNGFAKAE
jgi:hypothetical protein